MPSKKANKLTEEATEFGFLDNFLNVLITNMNPGDLSLDSQTSDKLSKLVNSEVESNDDLSGIDLKQFINSLKSELANEKPHKLTLDSIKATITRLISKFTSLKSSPIVSDNGLSSLEDTLGNESNDLVKTDTIKEESKDISTISYKVYQNQEQESSLINSDSEKLLFNLRKYLTKDEYNIIKKNIQSGSNNLESKLTPKVEAISKFLTEMAGKETDAKSRIVTKANDILLSHELDKTTNNSQANTLTKSDILVSKISEELNPNLSESESKITDQKSILNSSIDGKVVESEVKNIVGVDVKQNATSTKTVSDNIFANAENQVKAEQSLSDNTKKDSGEFSKEFTREQAKETIKQRIVKSDISELLTKTNTKKIETTKSETVTRSNFVENAIKTIKMTKSGGSNVARITLNPRSLGDLTMRISLIGNNVKLYIKADKSETAEHIDRQLPLLKERLTESGLKVEQVIIESSETDHLANNNENQNRNEQEELRRQFVKSFKNIAAKEEFDISIGNVVYNNSSPLVGYTQAGSTINV
jgi:flagellar hook-length control protein FliK